MKNAILLHGTGGSDQDYFWFASAKQLLEADGYDVWWPLLPHTEKPTIHETEAFIVDNCPRMDENTIIIARSSACPVVLDILRRQTTELKQVILVAGFYQSLDDDGYSDRMCYPRTSISLRRPSMPNRSRSLTQTMILGDEARTVANRLDAKLVVAEGQGHMGSIIFNQPYRDFSLLNSLLDL